MWHSSILVIFSNDTIAKGRQVLKWWISRGPQNCIGNDVNEKWNRKRCRKTSAAVPHSDEQVFEVTIVLSSRVYNTQLETYSFCLLTHLLDGRKYDEAVGPTPTWSKEATLCQSHHRPLHFKIDYRKTSKTPVDNYSRT